jgi:hypothetical protein
MEVGERESYQGGLARASSVPPAAPRDKALG